MSTSRHLFVRDLLIELECEGTLENAVALIAQIQAEGGTAKFNPFNTTVKAPGSTNYNDVPVQNYVSLRQGVVTTAKTFRQTNMKPLLQSLKNGHSAADYWANLPGAWGTHYPKGYTTLTWLADVRAHWFDRAMIAISGS